MAEPRRTPLYDAHVALGGRIVDFAGWAMPVQYGGILEEHEAVRERVGLFDVSHMGEILFEGPGALAALNRLVTNDLARCEDMQAQYSALLDDAGGIVDDVVVYRYSANRLLVCVNASGRDKDFAHLAARAPCRQASDEYAQLAVQGPLAGELVASMAEHDVRRIGTYRFAEDRVAGVSCLVARTGYTGEDGFELFCAPGDARKLWDELLERGRPYGIRPCGLGARDSLRLEHAFRLYGSDMDSTTTPLDAGLGWIVKLDKPDFVGKAALVAQKASGLARKLVGFKLTGRGVPRHGYPILSGGARVGEVTSGTMSPTLKEPIGLGYVPTALSREGTELAVEIRGNAVPAVVVKTPFLQKKPVA